MYGVNWRKQYDDVNRDEDLAAMSAIDTSFEEDLTVQSFKDECDINVMMRRMGVTGMVERAAQVPFFGDFTGIGSYQDALNRVLEAGEEFDSLPAKIRERFGNSPQRLMDFLSDEANAEEALELGLREAPKPAPAPLEVRVVDEPAVEPET